VKTVRTWSPVASTVRFVDGEVLEGQRNLPDEGSPENLDPWLVRPDVVGGPPPAEGPAAGGQLTDERHQGRVVRSAPGLDPQQGHGVAGDALPLREQLAGPVFVQEQEQRGVGRAVGVEHRRVQRSRQRGWPPARRVGC
jgi:hypothetical protein